MSGALEAVGFRAPTADFDGLEARGRLWGGNLTVLCSLLGTPHWPKVKGGILFLEDINEHPYRVERMLLQLQQAGVIDAQAAVLLGDFSGAPKSPLDKGYGIKDAVAALRARRWSCSCRAARPSWAGSRMCGWRTARTIMTTITEVTPGFP
jgi:muramoyltetrapeptide carboxypeptidase